MICTFWLAFFSSSLLRTLYQVQKFDTMCRIPLGNDMLLIYIYILHTICKYASIIENMVHFFRHSVQACKHC